MIIITELIIELSPGCYSNGSCVHVSRGSVLIGLHYVLSTRGRDVLIGGPVSDWSSAPILRGEGGASGWVWAGGLSVVWLGLVLFQSLQKYSQHVVLVHHALERGRREGGKEGGKKGGREREREEGGRGRGDHSVHHQLSPQRTH